LIVTKLIGYALETKACLADTAVALHGGLSTTQALQARAEIEQLDPIPGLLEAIDIGERFMFLETAQTLANNGVGSMNSLGGKSKGLASIFDKIATGTVINFNVVMRMGNEVYDRAAEALDEPDMNKRLRLLDSIVDDLEQEAQKSRSFGARAAQFLGGRDQMGKMIGNVLLSLLMPAFGAAERAEVQLNVRRDLSRLAYALAAYKVDQQHYPDSLAQLAPKYIAEVPKDPFTSEALRYSTTDDGYVLYSVGPNQRDEQGRERDSEPRGDDISAQPKKS
jgi:hypothetical protein